MSYKHLLTAFFLVTLILTSAMPALCEESASRCYFFEPFKHYAQAEGFAKKITEGSGVPCFIQQTSEQQWQPYFWFTSEQDRQHKLHIISAASNLGKISCIDIPIK